MFQMAKNYNSLNDALAVAKSESEKVKGEAKALKERIQTLEVEMQVERMFSFSETVKIINLLCH